MKKVIIFLCTFCISPFSMANADTLQSQLSAIHQAESIGISNIKAEQIRQDKIEAKHRAKLARIVSQKRKQAEQSARLRHKKALEKQKRLDALHQEKVAERLADKYRDQEYQDKLRDLEFKSKMIAIQKESARAARENDFIDVELNRQKAKTDILQSEADATRNVSKGTQNLMESEGRAKEDANSGWFN
ncbi:DUF5384 family protein [Photobacterium carnosum]|uniref:DUF5384 family protein n=1 Tax=Photobacterium carnosum TaxID=2023717 RepID=UPI00128DCEF2|nr:DUF5384 family protein [Photobacterium carnosum]KAE8178204.1 hypothetical protein CIT27_00030 [Photobacterium carnosum]MBY3789247.1 DUF5384 family protein [Photobacterium carnosum]MCD9495415.1 hypothetical protein [Photobacterium carnosum]MCD9498369.1 hypothetical protein [Photobacterium carnosum]MCD9523531.1 hypothetical protein [Photobacterium carnosum]